MVEYINYRGKELPIRISYLALKAISKNDKVESVQSLMTADVEVMEVLLFHGLRAGHHAMGIPFEIEKEECEYILDENFAEFTEILPRFLNDIQKKMSGLFENVENK